MIYFVDEFREIIGDRKILDIIGLLISLYDNLSNTYPKII